MNISTRGLAILAVAALSLGACGHDDKNVTPPPASQSASAVLPSGSGLPSSPPSAAPDHIGASATATATQQPEGGTGPLDFSQLDGDVPAPSKRLLAPSDGTPINGFGYAVSVFKSQRDFWEKYFTGDQLEMPRMNIDLVSAGDVSTSPCHKGEISMKYPTMVYCAETEQIIIPMDLLAYQWGGARKVGDLAAAITVSRHAANSLVIAVSSQLNVAAPSLTGELYVAACFSGVWAHSVYPQNTFTDKDLQTALSRSMKVPSELSGAKATADQDELTNAWISGFRSGRVKDCATNYWTRTS
jgi:hypothetical protein